MIMQYEYIIIGAGPAGLQLGYHFEKAGYNYLILEEGSGPGSFFKTYPRHRKLISINKVFTGYDNTEINLRWDWNSLLSDSEEMQFKNYSKKYFPDANDLVRYLEDFARHFKLRVQYGASVEAIGKNDDGGFHLRTGDGKEFLCRRLVIATGFKHLYLPDVPGIELAEKYTEMSVEPQDFLNQKVLIVGKGNSGFETADNLIETAALIHIASPTPVKMAWETKFVGHLRAINNNFLDTYQLKLQNAVLDATVKRIERRDGKYAVSVSYTHAGGEEEELIYDRVLLCTGWRFDDSIFEANCKPALVINDKLPAQTFEWESVNVKDLYFAGTLMQMRDYKKKQSGFIHGFRYNVQALHHILEQKYHGREWPVTRLEAHAEDLAHAVVQRVNLTSSLWQQTGYMCDLIVIEGDGKQAQYYEDLPADYVHESAHGENEHYYTVMLEFGKPTGDPFSINRQPVAESAASSSFLHPIVRRYSRGKLISEHHLLEDLFGEWRKEQVHVQPLIAYFSGELSAVNAASPNVKEALAPSL
jgi:thioredoxin reductase